MPKKIILVVEDSPTTMDIKCSILEGAGYETIRAIDGIEGITKLRSHRPDLILLDVQLPDMDGFNFYQMLKMNNDCKNIPVIMATAAMTAIEDKIVGLGMGAVEYLMMPFEPEDLIRAVDKAFKK